MIQTTSTMTTRHQDYLTSGTPLSPISVRFQVYKAMWRSGWLMDWDVSSVIWRFRMFSIYCSVSVYGTIKIQDSL